MIRELATGSVWQKSSKARVTRAARSVVEQLESRQLLSVTGAVFTTDPTGSVTNGNIYSSKDDVYLNGGPTKSGAAGLPDGNYYAEVTTPDGTVLGTSVGTANPTPITVLNGDFVTNVQLDQIMVTESDPTVVGFDDTTNAGGEYKVWVSQDPTFSPDNSKTDNFKVIPSSEPQPHTASISGLKFNDLNGNGVQDAGEPPLGGWTMDVYRDNGDGVMDDGNDVVVASAVTSSNPDPSQLGTFSVGGLGAGTYYVREEQQTGWTQTTTNPGAISVTGDGDTHDGNIFGNFQNITISGTKFHDLTANGFSSDDTPLGGVTIDLYSVDSLGHKTLIDQTTTISDPGHADNGTYTFNNGGAGYGPGGTYFIQEVVPSGWIETGGNAGYTITVGGAGQQSGQNSTGNNFDDAHIGAKGNPLTIGYWANKGNSSVTQSDVNFLNTLNIRTANGALLRMSGSLSHEQQQLSSWLLSATSTNAAYMLSAQLTAMELNVRHGGVNANSIVYAPLLTPFASTLGSDLQNGEFITISALMSDSNTELGTAGYTVNASFDRNFETALQQTLNSANNNLNFVI